MNDLYFRCRLYRHHLVNLLPLPLLLLLLPPPLLLLLLLLAQVHWEFWGSCIRGFPEFFIVSDCS